MPSATAATAAVMVIDPLNRTGKVAIPAAQIIDTKGYEEYRTASAKRELRDFSLCLLFQKGRCNAASRCHQIHVAPEYIDHVRLVAAAAKTCCAAHGDVHSELYRRSEAMRICVVEPEAGERTFELSCFARTAGLEKVLSSLHKSQQVVRVPSSRLCRLHQQSRCKFGQDCKNVHVCPDARPVADKAPAAVSALKPVTPKQGCPLSIDTTFDQLSCGVSCRSGSSAASGASSNAPSRTDSPRRLAPCSIDDMDDGAVKPLMTWSAPQGASSRAPITKPKKTIIVAGVVEEAWSCDESSAFDISAFEATIRSLCEDLDRAAFSPNCAQRVRSQSRFFADLLA